MRWPIEPKGAVTLAGALAALGVTLGLYGEDVGRAIVDVLLAVAQVVPFG